MNILFGGLTTSLGQVKITAPQLAVRYGDDESHPTEATGVTALFLFPQDTDLVQEGADLVRRIIDESRLSMSDIGGIVVSSNYTHDTLVPTIAPAIAERLGLSNVRAVSLGVGCGGMAQAVEYAVSIMTSSYSAWQKGKVFIVLSADHYSRCVNPHDPKTRYLFSDSVAGLTLRFGEPEKNGLVLTDVKSLSMTVPYDLNALRVGGEGLGSGRFFSLETRAVAKFVARIPEIISNMMRIRDWNGVSVIPHQANSRLLARFKDKIPEASSFYDDGIRTIGNTLNSSTLFGLEDSLKRNLLKSNDILLVPFGGEWIVGGIRLTLVT